VSGGGVIGGGSGSLAILLDTFADAPGSDGSIIISGQNVAQFFTAVAARDVTSISLAVRSLDASGGNISWIVAIKTATDTSVGSALAGASITVSAAAKTTPSVLTATFLSPVPLAGDTEYAIEVSAASTASTAALWLKAPIGFDVVGDFAAVNPARFLTSIFVLVGESISTQSAMAFQIIGAANIAPSLSPSPSAVAAPSSSPPASVATAPSSPSIPPSVSTLLDTTAGGSALEAAYTFIPTVTTRMQSSFLTGASDVALTTVSVWVRGVSAAPRATLVASIFNLDPITGRCGSASIAFAVPGMLVSDAIPPISLPSSSVVVGAEITFNVSGAVLNQESAYCLELMDTLPAAEGGSSLTWLGGTAGAAGLYPLDAANAAGLTTIAQDLALPPLFAQTYTVYTPDQRASRAIRIVGVASGVVAPSPSLVPPASPLSTPAGVSVSPTLAGTSGSPTPSGTISSVPPAFIIPVIGVVAVSFTLPGSDPVAAASSTGLLCVVRSTLADVAGVTVGDVNVDTITNPVTSVTVEVSDTGADPCASGSGQLLADGAFRQPHHAGRRLQSSGLAVGVEINVTKSTLANATSSRFGGGFGGSGGSGSGFPISIEAIVAAAIAETFSDPAVLDVVLADVIQAACTAAGMASCPPPSQVATLLALSYTPPVQEAAPHAAKEEKDSFGLIAGLVLGLVGGAIIISSAWLYFKVHRPFKAARKSKHGIVVHPDTAPTDLGRCLDGPGAGAVVPVVPVVPVDVNVAGGSGPVSLGTLSRSCGARYLSDLSEGIPARDTGDATVGMPGPDYAGVSGTAAAAAASVVIRARDGVAVSAAGEAAGAAWADATTTGNGLGEAFASVRTGAANAASVLGVGLATALESAAPAIPFVGAALGLLASILRLAQRMAANNEEALQLVERIGRLTGLVTEAGRDTGFVSRHSAIFDSLMGTLAEAEVVLAGMSDQSSLAALTRARGDAAKIATINRALSQHVAEFSAALQAETLSAVRAIHDVVSRRGLEEEAVARAAAAAAAVPPPPFSMQLRLADFAFDPPLATQLETAPRGSYGVVVFGIWRAVGAAVAVKLLPARSPSGEQLLTMMAWLGEAETMRRLRESRGPGKLPAHIVLLYGIGAEEDRKGVREYLVVMERMAGSLRDSLDKYASSGRTPALELALRWLLQTAMGIAECHQATVVHSDVKAANVLLTDRRDAKLGDMGTARVTRGIASTMTRGGTATMSGGARGSPL
jgi:hypothetical protein